MVEYSFMVRWVVGLILHSGPTELFLLPASPPHFIQATVSIKIRNVLIYICSFDLSCPILEQDNFIEMGILYCLRLFK